MIPAHACTCSYAPCTHRCSHSASNAPQLRGAAHIGCAPQACPCSGHGGVGVCPPLATLPQGAANISWDIRRPISSATFANDHGGAWGFTRSSPAVTPVTDRVTISYRSGIVGDLWRRISVTGSPVTIECVLKAIHEHFHSAITEEEYNTIYNRDHENPKLLSKSLHERTQLAIDKGENVWRVELRRVDCLPEGHYIFQGLQVTNPQHGNYKVTLTLGPRWEE